MLCESNVAVALEPCIEVDGAVAQVRLVAGYDEYRKGMMATTATSALNAAISPRPYRLPFIVHPFLLSTTGQCGHGAFASTSVSSASERTAAGAAGRSSETAAGEGTTGTAEASGTSG